MVSSDPELIDKLPMELIKRLFRLFPDLVVSSKKAKGSNSYLLQLYTKSTLQELQDLDDFREIFKSILRVFPLDSNPQMKIKTE